MPPRVPLNTALHVQLMHSVHEHHGVTLSMTPGIASLTTFTQPVAPDTVEVWVYNGAALTSTSRMRRGLLHGPQVNLVQGVPKHTMCFENGEMIQTTNCDVR